eukprot:gnl/MRDRNA2_/MRDRNA2_135492_c0_seq1.p1 gnl/MRDRNA2_/MRDRNA2_135492_c0~~gnl/MRDRNA2_/MRDRNA2_135492_c0_seq1.p1  ORF type:complete len:339 (+),score=55.16 gnl/MRDRNA2_/MRDRNA2_135492_c0_seq1:121-1017(+)
MAGEILLDVQAEKSWTGSKVASCISKSAPVPSGMTYTILLGARLLPLLQPLCEIIDPKQQCSRISEVALTACVVPSVVGTYCFVHVMHLNSPDGAAEVSSTVSTRLRLTMHEDGTATCSSEWEDEIYDGEDGLGEHLEAIGIWCRNSIATITVTLEQYKLQAQVHATYWDSRAREGAFAVTLELEPFDEGLLRLKSTEQHKDKWSNESLDTWFGAPGSIYTRTKKEILSETSSILTSASVSIRLSNAHRQLAEEQEAEKAMGAARSSSASSVASSSSSSLSWRYPAIPQCRSCDTTLG